MTAKCKTYIDFDFLRPIMVSAIGFKSANCCPSMDPRKVKIFYKVPEADKTIEQLQKCSELARQMEINKNYLKNWASIAELNE